MVILRLVLWRISHNNMDINDTIPVYPISSAAKLTDVPVRMLREYEARGLIRPRKVKGRRLFTNCEVGFIKNIRYYLRERQMTIGGLKEFYLRAACWEIKRCNMKQCPAYGNYTKQCYELVSRHKKCNPAICPYCPIFIIKTSRRRKSDTQPISPRVYFLPWPRLIKKCGRVSTSHRRTHPLILSPYLVCGYLLKL